MTVFTHLLAAMVGCSVGVTVMALLVVGSDEDD